LARAPRVGRRLTPANDNVRPVRPWKLRRLAVLASALGVMLAAALVGAF
jgi:hypothetical protein